MAEILINLDIQGLNLSSHEIILKINGDLFIPQKRKNNNTQNSSEGGFCQFIEKEILNLISCQRLRSAEIHKSAIKQFMQYRNSIDIPIVDVDSEEIKRFEIYLRDRKLSLNTISFYMRTLRSCYNKAIEKHHFIDKQPFKHVYTGIEETDKRALDLDSIKAIMQCKLVNRDESFARDLFMFSFYTRGMSFVDMAYLKRCNIKQGWLIYKRHKTGRSIKIKWESCMQRIVDRYHNGSSDYLLPIIHSSNGKERNQYRGIQHKVNQALKRIASYCHIKSNLTMYVARHSWANAANTLNQPLELISHGMGHSSTKTTRIYLHSIKMSQIDELNNCILQEINAL